MKTLDIREHDDKPVERIVFSEHGRGDVCVFDKDNLSIKWLVDDEEEEVYSVDSAEEAENLIKALHKALELGWFK